MEIYLDELSNNEFEKLFKFDYKIESGAFGQVIKANDLRTNQSVAVKILQKDTDTKKLKIIREEINIFNQLNHRNIVKFLGFLEETSRIYIIMELLRGGTIKSKVEHSKTNGSRLKEEECSIIMNNLLKAVKYLHDNEIVHRDIKPENIMFKDDNLNSLKLIDFGLSAKYESFQWLSDHCGTLIYMAPEQIEKRAYSKTVDMWSCGLIMYYLLNEGEHPIYEPGMSRKEFFEKLKNPNFESKKKISKMAQFLLHKLLEVNPYKRYTVDKALNHPWITREKYQNIPETYLEGWRVISIKRKFKQVYKSE